MEINIEINKDDVIIKLKKELADLIDKIKILTMIHGDIYIDWVNWRIMDGAGNIINELD